MEFHEVTTEDLELIIDEVRKSLKLELALSVHPASSISRLLPSLSIIEESLPELTVTASRMEKFDLCSCRWSSVDQFNAEGAYRLVTRPLLYAVVSRSNENTHRRAIADVRLAKYLAAKNESFSLMGYDSSTGTLRTSVGAPLPTLFERAAVLCTGRLPTDCDDGTLAYKGVPPMVAENIWAALNSNS